MKKKDRPQRIYAGFVRRFRFYAPTSPGFAGCVALIVTASATLSLGQGLRIVIDGGFASGQAEVLNESLGLFVIFILVLTVGTFVRFYFVSWVGERVSATFAWRCSTISCICMQGFLKKIHPVRSNPGSQRIRRFFRL